MQPVQFAPHQKRLQALDGLRGYAVLMVFLVHYIGSVSGLMGRNLTLPINQLHWTDIALLWLRTSNYGVYIFFGLSSFLIGRMFIVDPRRSFRTFIVRRFQRIYPAFLISLLISGAIGILVTGYMKFSWITLLQNLFFLNGWFALGEIASYNFVTWSLFFEFVFYLTIPLAFIPLRYISDTPAARVVLGFAVLVLTAAAMKLGATFLFFLTGFVLANVPDEALSLLAGQLRSALVIPIYMLVTGLYSLGVIGMDIFVPAYMVATAMLIVAAAYGEGLLNRIATQPLLLRLGRISYSFYLVHATAILLYFWTLQHLPTNRFTTGLTVLLSLPMTLAMSWYAARWLYEVAERPYFEKDRSALVAPIGRSHLETHPLH
jgi:exopolysaccharide production protein ExoZ